MNKSLLAILIAVVLLTGPVFGTIDGYSRFAFPVADPQEPDVFQLINSAILTDAADPGLAVGYVFSPGMVWIHMSGDQKPKLQNMNMASRFNPGCQVDSPAEGFLLVTLDFGKSKSKPTQRELNAILAAIIQTLNFNQIGVSFVINGLPNAKVDSKKRYTVSDIPKLLGKFFHCR